MRRSRKQRRQPSQAALDYCRGTRQWRREERIAHAQYQRALPDADVSFWQDVLRIQGAKA
jgi:hypothetical protein